VTYRPGQLGPAASKLYDAFLRLNGGPRPWADVAVVAGITTGNGYFYGGRKELIERGIIFEDDDRLVHFTAEAVPAAVAANPRFPQRGDLVSLWSGKLRAPAPDMLRYLAGRYFGDDTFGWTKLDDLAGALSLKPGNGYWYGGLSALRKAGLIEEKEKGGPWRVIELLRRVAT
jgi:hypothetical protein